ncbi:MAG: tetratricopeptide repeat protein [Arcobacteraceae bacterium]|jgi:Ca-activated chloride channel family protein|nr:tetratricopeptide repeat protein [Arcobacteraceae bacterium]
MKFVSGIVFFIGVFFLLNIFEASSIFQAQKEFEDGNLEKSLEHFSAIETHLDEKAYNMGNILYKQAKYHEAIKEYQKMTKEELAYQKYYNMGNAYLQIEKYDEAIESYKKSLALKQDPDTKHNLETVLAKKVIRDKKMAKELTKQQEQNSIVGMEEDMSGEENIDNGIENKATANKPKGTKEKNGNTASSLQTKREKNERELTRLQKILSIKHKRLTDKTMDSDDQKWMEILDQREVETLMMPLTSDGVKNEHKQINPW